LDDLLRIGKLEQLIYLDKWHLSTLASYSIAIAIYVNLFVFVSPVVGGFAFILYFLINAVFLEHAFFGGEDFFLRMMFGVLLLVMILSLVGWVIMIVYNLDAIKLVLVLLIATTFSSLSNARMKCKDVSN
jgi:hypothetical protein